jgi:hypothetical protein
MEEKGGDEEEFLDPLSCSSPHLTSRENGFLPRRHDTFLSSMIRCVVM